MTEPVYAPDGKLVEATFEIHIYRGIHRIHHERIRLGLSEWDKCGLHEKFDKYLRTLECSFIQKRDPCPERHPITSRCVMMEKSRPEVRESRSEVVAISWTGKPEIDGQFFVD